MFQNLAPREFILRLTGLSLLTLVSVVSTVAQPSFQVIAFTGDVPPGLASPVRYTSYINSANFVLPQVNESGHIAFVGYLEGSGVPQDAGIWSGPPTALTLRMRTGQRPLNTPTGTAIRVWPPLSERFLLSPSGEVGLPTILSGPDVTNLNRDAFVAATQTGFTTLLRGGAAAPGGGGLVSSIANARYAYNAGRLAVVAGAAQTDGTYMWTGVWSGVPGFLNLLARQQGPVPGRPGWTVEGVYDAGLGLSPDGRCSFRLTDGNGSVSRAGVWMTGDFANPIDQVAHEGDLAPGSNPPRSYATLNTHDAVAVNTAAEMVYPAWLGNFDWGLWLYDEWSGARRIVASGQPAPGLPGEALGMCYEPRLNLVGEVAFLSVIGQREALFAGFPSRARLVCAENAPAPAVPSATIQNVAGIFDLNRAGQVAYSAWLAGPGITLDNAAALYVQQPNGAHVLVLRQQQVITVRGAQRTVREFEWGTGSWPATHCGGFNGAGKLAVRVRFTDNSEAILLFSIPPASPPADGDINGDEQVNLTDLTLLLSAFGSIAGQAAYNGQADFNRDAAIDIGDLTVLLAHFGT